MSREEGLKKQLETVDNSIKEIKAKLENEKNELIIAELNNALEVLKSQKSNIKSVIKKQ